MENLLGYEINWPATIALGYFLSLLLFSGFVGAYLDREFPKTEKRDQDALVIGSFVALLIWPLYLAWKVSYWFWDKFFVLFIDKKPVQDFTNNNNFDKGQ